MITQGICPRCGSNNSRKAPIVETESGVCFYFNCNDCGEYFQETYVLTHTSTASIIKNDIPRRSLDELLKPRKPEELPNVIETCYEG